MEKQSTQKNFTTVIANIQTKGRGQLNTSWHSEPFKNLTFSTLIKINALKVTRKFYLNFAVSLAVFEVLSEYKIPKLKIKWPNDILSGNRKICGILIENTISKDRIVYSVIGIGLNVNQEHFENAVMATSMIHHLKKETDLEKLFMSILKKIKKYVTYMENKKWEELKQLYLRNLYKINTATAFLDKHQHLFMGIIRNVNSNGKLVIELENASLKEFDIKEVIFAKV